MATAWVQDKSTSWFGGSGTTESITFDASVGSGNLLIIAVFWATTTSTIDSVAGNGNTYTLIRSRSDSTNGTMSLYYAKGVASGATTVTVTWSADPGFGALIGHEVSGADTVAPLDQSADNVQANPAESTDAITSTSVITTSDGQYIFGTTWDDQGSNPTIAAGTNYTAREAPSNARSEDRIQASAGSIAVTFTRTGGTFPRFITGIATFKEPPSQADSAGGMTIIRMRPFR
jgi:hypothetical protein